MAQEEATRDVVPPKRQPPIIPQNKQRISALFDGLYAGASPPRPPRTLTPAHVEPKMPSPDQTQRE